MQLPGTRTTKAAILLPVTIGEQQCEMQLDTGAPNTYVSLRNLPFNEFVQLTKFEAIIPHLKIGSESVSGPIRTLEYSDTDSSNISGECQEPIGVIGNDFLRGKRISLDLLNGKFKIFSLHSPSENEGRKSERKINKIDFIHDGNGGVVPVIAFKKLGGRKIIFELDTGSASTDMIVLRKKDWLEIVNLGELPDSYFESNRWGNKIRCYYAPSKEGFKFNGFSIDSNENVFYCEDPAEPVTDKNPLFGLIGLSPFINKTITIDFLEKTLEIGN